MCGVRVQVCSKCGKCVLARVLYSFGCMKCKFSIHIPNMHSTGSDQMALQYAYTIETKRTFNHGGGGVVVERDPAEGGG